jgi:hypothetical protein
MKFTSAQIDAAAKVARRIKTTGFTTPWEELPKSRKATWVALATVMLAAAAALAPGEIDDPERKAK